jgi:hypothetical protein
MVQAALRGQSHVKGSSSPEIAVAAAEQRNVTTAATSSRSMYRTPSPIAAMFAAVRIEVGATAFARTPFFLSSLAIDRMSVTTPVFATAYADLLAPAEPGMAASEAKEHDRALRDAKHWQKRARREIGGGEVDRDLPLPDV